MVELSPVRLAMYLWVNFEEAAGDLPGLSVAEAFERFVTWTRAARPYGEVRPEA